MPNMLRSSVNAVTSVVPAKMFPPRGLLVFPCFGTTATGLCCDGISLRTTFARHSLRSCGAEGRLTGVRRKNGKEKKKGVVAKLSRLHDLLVELGMAFETLNWSGDDSMSKKRKENNWDTVWFAVIWIQLLGKETQSKKNMEVLERLHATNRSGWSVTHRISAHNPGALASGCYARRATIIHLWSARIDLWSYPIAILPRITGTLVLVILPILQFVFT